MRGSPHPQRSGVGKDSVEKIGVRYPYFLQLSGRLVLGINILA